VHSLEDFALAIKGVQLRLIEFSRRALPSLKAMDQFCELQLRIDKLDRSIAAAESEEAKLAQECEALRSELAIEEENERVRREEALLLQHACVKHEVSSGHSSLTFIVIFLFDLWFDL
jgi:hypothetical protein